MSDEKKPEQTTREIMDKVYAMTTAEFNQMMFDNFRRLCSRPLPDDHVGSPPDTSGDRGGK